MSVWHWFLKSKMLFQKVLKFLLRSNRFTTHWMYSIMTRRFGILCPDRDSSDLHSPFRRGFFPFSQVNFPHWGKLGFRDFSGSIVGGFFRSPYIPTSRVAVGVQGEVGWDSVTERRCSRRNLSHTAVSLSRHFGDQNRSEILVKIRWNITKHTFLCDIAKIKTV